MIPVTMTIHRWRRIKKQNLLRGTSFPAKLAPWSKFWDAFLETEKKGCSKQIFTALFTQLLLKYARFFLSLGETQVKDRIFEFPCIQLVCFIFEINTWIDRSHVGPREDSFGSANEERKRPRVSRQVCMKVQSRQF